MVLKQLQTCWYLPVAVGLIAVCAGLYLLTHGSVRVPKRYRFGSFAEVRDASMAKWYVDGQDYMSAVGDAIKAAKHEILITDWQMNPHIFMKRLDTGVTSLEWRLDKLLLRKAEEGVRVYILLYWETKVVMDLGSDYTLSVLKHKNIRIHRHPAYSTPVNNPSTLLRWSHHEKIVVVDRSISFVGGIDLSFGRWDTHTHDLTDDYPPHPCTQEEECAQASAAENSGKRYQRWIGKDYGNTFIGGGRTNLAHPLVDYIDRSRDPRMPWHDVSCSINGKVALDVANHFIQRYNAINNNYSWMKFWNDEQLSVENWNHFEQHTIPDPSADNVTIQVLRSVGSWSANQPHEDSILTAYLHAIEKAEHFIYIENQFFISSQSKERFRKVENEIQVTLADRIFRAYENGEDFHVFIILPLQPEFPGDWGTDSGKDLTAVSYWNYATLYSGEDSLFHRLKKRNLPVESLHHYLSVYGLRTHGVLDDKFITEIIYVHSKLMIVDDKLAIIGSANINDRSMLGDRDSEVDVVIEDKDMLDGKMNGKLYSVGKFSHGLRCRLMKEHLGLMSEGGQGIELDVEDPVAYDFYTTLGKIAISNTNIYEQVFRRKILPTNQVWNFEDLRNWKSFEGLADILPEGAKEELSKIQGNVVIFPSSFLKDVLEPCFFDYLNVYVDIRGRSSNFDNGGIMYA